MIIGGFFLYHESSQHAFAQWQSLGDVEECRAYLRDHDLVNANTCFKEAVSVDPTDQVANFFYSVTRILVFINDDAFNDLLDRFGVTSEGRDLYDWSADLQRDAEGNVVLPDDAPTSGEVLAFLKDILLPEVGGALGNLEIIGDTFNLLLDPAETQAGEYLEVDYGDIALYRSALHALKSLILILDAYDLDVDIDDIVAEIENDDFSINLDLLDTYTNLLMLKPSHLLAEAKSAVRDAIDSYIEASAFIRAETDDQENDLITIDPEDLENEAKFRNALLDIENSLDGPYLIGDEELEDPFRLDLTQFFDDPIHIRDYLPQFTDDNEIVTCSFPDPTFSGILPDFNQDTLNNLLHLPVPVSGTIDCASWTSGNIFVTAFDSPGFANYDRIASASFYSPGPYTFSLNAGQEVWIHAYWDKDGDSILSPGDYYGSYPGNPVEIISEDCSGPDNVDLELSDQVIGIKGRITCGGEPVVNASASVWSGKCWQDWLGWTSTDENGYYVFNFLSVTPVYVYVSVWPLNIYGWWDGSSLTNDCNQALAVDPTAGETIINIEVCPDLCECDLNHDGRCDMQDWLLFGENWGRTDCGTPPGSGNPPNDCECDLTNDGRCDMQDWLLFGEDWGRTDCPIPQ